MASNPIVAVPPAPQPAFLPLKRRILRHAFHLLYNQLSWSYDLVAATVSAGYWHRWRCAALEYVQGPRVLEIACGPGHLLIEMVRRGHTCTAIDRSPAMLKHTRTNLQRALRDEAANIELREGSAQALPFDDNSFDTVVMTFPTEFIREEATLREIARVLKHGGNLVIVEDAQLPINRIVPKMLNWALAQTSTAAHNLYTVIPNERLYQFGMKGGWVASCGDYGVVRLLVATKE